jgi:hypothetical protein
MFLKKCLFSPQNFQVFLLFLELSIWERDISVPRFSKKQSQSLYKVKFLIWSWLHGTQKIDENRSFLGPFPCQISLKMLPSLSYSFLPEISNIAKKRTICMNIFPKANCYKENIVIWNNVIWDVLVGPKKLSL